RHTRWPRDWSSDVCSSDLKLCTLSGFVESASTAVLVYVRSKVGTPGRVRLSVFVVAACIPKRGSAVRSRVSCEPSAERPKFVPRSEEHTSELQSRGHLVCR